MKRRFGSLLVLTALVFGCMIGGNAHAQKAPIPVETVGESTTLRVYYLRHIDSATAYDVTSTMLARNGVSNLAIDKPSNSLIVNANSEGHDALIKLLETLDRPPTKRDELKMIPANNLDSSILARMLPNVEVAESATSIVLKGSPGDLEIAEALALQLVREVEKSLQPRGLMVEVLWLTEDSLPNGFRLQGELADKLSDRGFSPLTVVATLETRVSPQGDFASESTQGLSILKVQGELTSVDDGLEVVLETNAERDPILLEFESTFFAQPDQWLVFGVAQGSESEQDNLKRSLILARIKKDLPL
ncbi:MAG: secretin N-terminal domain-containing protein [Planctomycetota bacterium]